MAFKLITDDDVKALLKGTAQTSTEWDSLFNDTLIPAIGELFANYCHRPDFDKLARTEYFSPVSRQYNLLLSSPPVAATPAVQVWEDSNLPRFGGSETLLVNGTDYFVHESRGQIEKLSPFLSGSKTVKVTYTGGYLTADATGVPPLLKFAAMSQVSIYFKNRDLYGIATQSVAGGSITLPPIMTLPKQVTLLLDHFKFLDYGCQY